MNVYEAIHQRRSHRMYQPDLPSKEVLERVIDAALWAPSGTNAQAWEITVMAGKVRDEFVELTSQAIKNLLPILQKAQVPEKGQELVMKFFKNLGGAPVVIAVTIFKNPDDPTNMTNIESGAALFQNLLLAAQRRGPGHLLDDRGPLPGKRNFEVPGKREPAAPGHHPHRLFRQRTAGAAPERPGSALAGVLGSCQ